MARAGLTTFVRLGCMALLLAGGLDALGADSLSSEETPRALRPGLIGRYSTVSPAPAPPVCVRIDPSIAFDWSDGAPDDRLAPGRFSAVWEGWLRVDQDGTYRFSVQTSGDVEIWLDGRPLRLAEGRTEPQSIAFGDHAIRVQYVAAAERPSIRLLWSSDRFGEEVVNPRYLGHDEAAETEWAQALLDERGRQVVERYACVRCHAIPGVDRTRRPGLAMPQASQMNPQWIARWLRNPQAVRPGTRMGAPGGSPEEIEQLITLLLGFLPQPDIVARIEPRWRCGQATDPLDGRDLGELIPEGRKQFYELGCAACHAPETPTAIDPRRAPSLADVGGKWSKAYLRQLLTDPVGRHPNGGMPDFALKPNELDSLVAYLTTFRAGASTEPTPPRKAAATADPEMLEQGKKVIQKRGCYACHHHPENKLMDGPVLGAVPKNPEKGCLRTDRATSLAPFFTLSAEDRKAIGVFLANRPSSPSKIASDESAHRVLYERLNCSACHVRDGSGGEQLKVTLAPFLAHMPKSAQRSTLPPDISGTGARLLPTWLSESLLGKVPSNRPWQVVRMPRFSLNDTERASIVHYLAFRDALVSSPAPHKKKEDVPDAGAALFGKGGFNCVGCHYAGRTTWGDDRIAPDLTFASSRLQRDWFVRWLADPSRVLPGTAMPAFTIPAPGVAGENLSAQKEGLWKYLLQLGSAQDASGETGR